MVLPARNRQLVPTPAAKNELPEQQHVILAQVTGVHVADLGQGLPVHHPSLVHSH